MILLRRARHLASIVTLLCAAASFAWAQSPRQEQRGEADTKGDSSALSVPAPPARQIPVSAPQPNESDQQPWYRNEWIRWVAAKAWEINWSNIALVIAAVWAGRLALRTLKAQSAQIRLNRLALTANRKAAEAAETSAAAVMLAERAYIAISHHAPGIEIGEMAVTRAGEEDLGGWHDVKFKFGIKNHGNIPATITDIVIGHFIDSPANIPPPPSGPGSGEHLFLVKDDVANDDRTFQISYRDLPQLGLTLRFWVMGYVDYIDVFKIRRRVGYARYYDPSVDQETEHFDPITGLDDGRYGRRNNLPFVTQNGYNYDRPREKHEGNDWNES